MEDGHLPTEMPCAVRLLHRSCLRYASGLLKRRGDRLDGGKVSARGGKSVRGGVAVSLVVRAVLEAILGSIYSTRSQQNQAAAVYKASVV